MNPTDAATQTLREYSQYCDTITLPIDVIRIALNMNITLMEELFPYPKRDVYGYIAKTDSTEPFTIGVNRRTSDQEKRLTIATLLGIYAKTYADTPLEKLGETGRTLRAYDFSLYARPEKSLAYQYGLSLLMPPSILGEYWGRGWSKLKIARAFAVNLTQLEAQLDICGLREPELGVS